MLSAYQSLQQKLKSAERLQGAMRPVQKPTDTNLQALASNFKAEWNNGTIGSMWRGTAATMKSRFKHGWDTELWDTKVKGYHDSMARRNTMSAGIPTVAIQDAASSHDAFSNWKRERALGGSSNTAFDEWKRNKMANAGTDSFSVWKKNRDATGGTVASGSSSNSAHVNLGGVNISVVGEMTHNVVKSVMEQMEKKLHALVTDGLNTSTRRVY
jgi:hypothetical protein